MTRRPAIAVAIAGVRVLPASRSAPAVAPSFMPLNERALGRAVRTLARSEPRFAHIVKRHGPPPLWRREPGFETLVLLMLEQQVSLAQALTMYTPPASTPGPHAPQNVAALGE